MSLLTESEELKVKDLGEKELLARLRKYCSDRLGDDCAVMGAIPSDRQMVVTTDMLIDGVHFSDRTTSPEDVGWRAAAANLSDLAAMGACPWGLVIAVGLPADTTVSWLVGVYRGFKECLQHHGQGAEIVGGDLVRSTIRTLSVTAFGQVEKNRLIQRHTAQVGDSIWISGSHGRSKAGLELLLNPELISKLDGFSPMSFYQAHQRPIPRFDVLPLISQTERVSGMDSSDGLADGILQICQASKVGAKIYWHQIPIAPGLELLAEERALDWILYGGEDFELVLTLTSESARELCQALPDSAIIGEIIQGDRVEGIEDRHSFQHFS